MPKLKRQAMFNKVVRHLFKQRVCARSDGTCKYRTSQGLMCAAGCLIPDNLYHKYLEGGTVMARLSFFEDLVEDTDLLSKLQSIHDCQALSSWYECLKTVASKFKLKTNVLSKFKGVKLGNQ